MAHGDVTYTTAPVPSSDICVGLVDTSATGAVYVDCGFEPSHFQIWVDDGDDSDIYIYLKGLPGLYNDVIQSHAAMILLLASITIDEDPTTDTVGMHGFYVAAGLVAVPNQFLFIAHR